MSMRVLFNGTVLIRPGGATKVDASLFASASLSGVGVVALIGEADGGEPNSINIFSAPEKGRSYFRSGPLADAMGIAFQPANDVRVPGGAAQVVCVKTNQSTKATKTLQGTGVANGTTSAAKAGPYNLEPTQALKVSIDGGAPVVITFSATAATKAGSGATYTAPTGKTLLLKVDDGEVQTFIADAGCTTAAATAALINSQIRGVQAVVNVGEVDLKSDRRGTSSKVEVTGGTGNVEFGQAIGVASGTGNVTNIDAVTASEANGLIQTAIGVTGTAAGDPVTVTSATVGGSSSVQFSDPTPAPLAADFGFDYLLHGASAPVNVMKLDSIDYGEHNNKITALVADNGLGKQITITFQDGSKLTQETSPVLGGTAEFTIVYAGLSSTALCTVSSTQLTVTLTGGIGPNHVQTDGSQDLVVPFSSYTTLYEMLAYINEQTGYTATAITNNAYSLQTTDLDYVTSQSCKTTALSLFAKLFRCIDWVNKNSSLVAASRVAGGPTAPLATVVAVNLTGGTRGFSTVGTYQDALDALLAIRVNQVVPLLSTDIVGVGGVITNSFASVLAALEYHAAYASSTKGKNERQAWAGMSGNKSALLSKAGLLNSPHLELSGQKISVLDSQSNLVELDEWAFALACAGMRAGSDLGEPITWKYLRAYGLSQDASWNPMDDGDDMILGGILIAENVPNKGIRVIKGVTTYTREDNDAYTEESVVQVWKNVSYELRTFLEDLFIGRRATPTNIEAVKSQADAKLSQLRSAGAIVDSTLSDGTVLYAYRDLSVEASGDTVSVSVVVSPVSGINFILNSIFLVPAQISV